MFPSRSRFTEVEVWELLFPKIFIRKLTKSLTLVNVGRWGVGDPKFAVILHKFQSSYPAEVRK